MLLFLPLCPHVLHNDRLNALSPIYRYKQLAKNGSEQRIYVIGEHGQWLHDIAELLQETKYKLIYCRDIAHTIELCLEQSKHLNTIIIDEHSLKGNELKSLKAAAGNDKGEVNLILASKKDNPDIVRNALKRGIFFFIMPAFSTDMAITTLERAMNTEVSLASQLNALDPQSQLPTLVNQATFSIKTPNEAQTIATILGYIAPTPHRVSVGLLELFLNAIEHGNLGIGFQRKAALLASGEFQNTVNEMLQQPEFSDKKVTIQFKKLDDKLVYEVSDEGRGFDPKPYLEFEQARSLEKNGRGILIAKRYSFDDLKFENNGSTVIASINLD